MTTRIGFAPLFFAMLAAVLAACGGAASPAVSSTSGSPAKPSPSAASSAAAPGSAAAVASASGAANPSGLRTVNFAIPAIDLSQFHVQVPADEGFFAKHGIDAKLLKVAPPTAIAAVQSSEVQFTTVTGSAMRAAIQGLPVRVAAYTQIVSFSYVTKSDVKSLAELKGKKLGVTSQTGDDYRYTLAALKSVNLGVNDVQLLTVGSSEEVAKALIGGQLDGGAIAAPFPQELHEKGFNVLTDPGLLELPSGGFAGTTKTLEGDPAMVEATLAAIVDGIQWTKTHPQEAADYFAQKYSLSPEVAKEAYDQQVKSLRFDYSDEKLQAIIDRAVEEAKATNKPAIGDVFDTQSFTRYRDLAHTAGLA